MIAVHYLSIAFPVWFEFTFFRSFFGGRLLGRGRGRGRGGLRAVPAAHGAAVTAAHRSGTGRPGRRCCGGGRRGRCRRRGGGRGGRRGRGGGRHQTQRGRVLGLGVFEPRGMLAGRYRVGCLLAAGLLQNRVQVDRPLVRRAYIIKRQNGFLSMRLHTAQTAAAVCNYPRVRRIISTELMLCYDYFFFYY